MAPTKSSRAPRLGLITFIIPYLYTTRLIDFFKNTYSIKGCFQGGVVILIQRELASSSCKVTHPRPEFQKAWNETSGEIDDGNGGLLR